ncbi:gamma-tocopherol methyltransferase [Striga asiatica]|uniref:Gamma-tocopherol methyltransferase n=1 Tax=Striga asiatica TaxID=4170 RepID=A0A5A7P830_STRAF|nr:gamma-tocopherol methyltransferase [Striga asiatica]
MTAAGVVLCGRPYSIAGPLPSLPNTNPITTIAASRSFGRGRRTNPVHTLSSTRRRMAAPLAAGGADSLKKGIAELYDESSGIWEDIWGDHMHHGFYEPGADVSISDHRSAQIRMIEEALRFASLSDDLEQKPVSVVDVGCGIGGSSRYLALKYGSNCQGVTLSPVQAKRAQELAAAQGLNDKAIADALNQPFPDGKFDLVWSMESGEHMPNKAKFVNELARVAAPGGRIIIVTWCHRDLSPGESLRTDEQDLLNKICGAYYLPEWCSTADYVKLLKSLSMEDIKSADWSEYVAPFWPAVIKSALTWKGITSLLRSEIRANKPNGSSHGSYVFKHIVIL